MTDPFSDLQLEIYEVIRKHHDRDALYVPGGHSIRLGGDLGHVVGWPGQDSRVAGHRPEGSQVASQPFDPVRHETLINAVSAVVAALAADKQQRHPAIPSARLRLKGELSPIPHPGASDGVDLTVRAEDLEAREALLDTGASWEVSEWQLAGEARFGLLHFGLEGTGMPQVSLAVDLEAGQASPEQVERLIGLATLQVLVVGPGEQVASSVVTLPGPPDPQSTLRRIADALRESAMQLEEAAPSHQPEARRWWHVLRGGP